MHIWAAWLNFSDKAEVDRNKGILKGLIEITIAILSKVKDL